MSARVKLPEPLDRLLRSQLETAIQEAAFHRDDDLISKKNPVISILSGFFSAID